MKENGKKFNSDLPPGSEELFNRFKIWLRYYV